MQRLTRDRISYVFDRRLEPVLRVAEGEVFQVETEDARTGQTRTPETTRPEYVKALRSKGAVLRQPRDRADLVRGAEPGDTLAVHIQAMECDTLGFFGYWPFIYHLQDWFAEPVTGAGRDPRRRASATPCRRRPGPHASGIPTRPMIGCIGTAPHLEVPTTGNAGRFGGNLDVPEVCPGSTIYLPVAVPGGYLYLGDCHPYQGDGEVSGCEMRSLVTAVGARAARAGRATPSGPGSRRRRTWSPSGRAARPRARSGWPIRDMILWLEERHGWTKDDARTLLALTGDLRPGQMQVTPYTMRLIVPKEYLPPLPG